MEAKLSRNHLRVFYYVYDLMNYILMKPLMLYDFDELRFCCPALLSPHHMQHVYILCRYMYHLDLNSYFQSYSRLNSKILRSGHNVIVHILLRN